MEWRDAWTKHPSGWLVAPASSAYTAADPGDAELWMVSATEVAEAAAERFVPIKVPVESSSAGWFKSAL